MCSFSRIVDDPTGININSRVMGLVALLVAVLLDMTSTTGLVPPVSPYMLRGNLHIHIRVQV